MSKRITPNSCLFCHYYFFWWFPPKFYAHSTKKHFPIIPCHYCPVARQREKLCTHLLRMLFSHTACVHTLPPHTYTSEGAVLTLIHVTRHCPRAVIAGLPSSPVYGDRSVFASAAFTTGLTEQPDCVMEGYTRIQVSITDYTQILKYNRIHLYPGNYSRVLYIQNKESIVENIHTEGRTGVYSHTILCII